MLQTATTKPLAWSYSALTAYETCPWRRYLTGVSRQVKEPQTEATIEGNNAHKALELYVGGSAALPKKYANWLPMADRLRAAKGTKRLEYKFALTSALRETEYFAKDVWLRGVLDVSIQRPKELILLDYKTGKRKVDGDQLRLFAMAGMALWPHVEVVKTGFIWLATNQMDTQTYTRDDKQAIFQEFAARVHRMELSAANNDWPKRPSGLCKAWCPVGKKLCEHCGS